MREVADTRVHGTTGEAPTLRLECDERSTLMPLAARAPFLQVRELARRVHTDACVELYTNRYSMPRRLVGETVTVVVDERRVRLLYAGQKVAFHAQNTARRATIIDRSHLIGIVGAQLAGGSWLGREDTEAPLNALPAAPAELLRPLAEYECALGGSC
jgi:hypothetical protein